MFDKVGFSGNHSKTIALVQSGAYQVGAVNFKVWETELQDGKVDPHKVSVIWKTPPYPDYQWSIRGDVDRPLGSGFKDKVQAALLEHARPGSAGLVSAQRIHSGLQRGFSADPRTAREIKLID